MKLTIIRDHSPADNPGSDVSMLQLTIDHDQLDAILPILNMLPEDEGDPAIRGDMSTILEDLQADIMDGFLREEGDA